MKFIFHFYLMIFIIIFGIYNIYYDIKTGKTGKWIRKWNKSKYHIDYWTIGPFNGIIIIILPITYIYYLIHYKNLKIF